MKKLDILPEFIYSFEASKSIRDSALQVVNKLEFIENPNNTISKDKLLHEKDNFLEVGHWFNKCLDEICKDLQLECEELRPCICWANKSQVGQWHHMHKHAFSWASGIFYLTESSSHTWFSKSNFWPKNEILDLYKDTVENHALYRHPTTPGELIIFPSTLWHSVNEHDLLTPRYSISFNTLPCGKVGSLDIASGFNVSRYSSK